MNTAAEQILVGDEGGPFLLRQIDTARSVLEVRAIFDQIADVLGTLNGRKGPWPKWPFKGMPRPTLGEAKTAATAVLGILAGHPDVGHPHAMDNTIDWLDVLAQIRNAYKKRAEPPEQWEPVERLRNAECVFPSTQTVWRNASGDEAVFESLDLTPIMAVLNEGDWNPLGLALPQVEVVEGHSAPSIIMSAAQCWAVKLLNERGYLDWHKVESDAPLECREAVDLLDRLTCISHILKASAAELEASEGERAGDRRLDDPATIAAEFAAIDKHIAHRDRESLASDGFSAGLLFGRLWARLADRPAGIGKRRQELAARVGSAKKDAVAERNRRWRLRDAELRATGVTNQSERARRIQKEEAKRGGSRTSVSTIRNVLKQIKD